MARGLGTGEIVNFTITTYEDYDKTSISLLMYQNSSVADSELTKPIKYGWNEIKFSFYIQEELFQIFSYERNTFTKCTL